MLIADSKDLRVNPLSPRARDIWPDFAAVVIPATDSGDLWLRSMENPSHDSLSTAQLPTDTERSDADRLFKRVRSEIAGIIEDMAEIGTYGEESNIDELTGVLSDMGDGAEKVLATSETTPLERDDPGDRVDASFNLTTVEEESVEGNTDDGPDPHESTSSGSYDPAEASPDNEPEHLVGGANEG